MLLQQMHIQSPSPRQAFFKNIQLQSPYGPVKAGAGITPKKTITPIPQAGHGISRFFFTTGKHQEQEPASFRQRRKCAPIIRLEKTP